MLDDNLERLGRFVKTARLESHLTQDKLQKYRALASDT